MIEMFVDRRDYHPVGMSAAFLPKIIVQYPCGHHVGIGIAAHEWPHLHAIVRAQHFERAVGGAIVVNDIAIDQRIVVTEEEGQHLFLVPDDRIKVDPHHTPQSRSSGSAESLVSSNG